MVTLGLVFFSLNVRAQVGTNCTPDVDDRDGDTMQDVWEITYGLNASNVADKAPNPDPDDDGLANFEECANDTHPKVSDTDKDGFLDGVEVKVYQTSPTDANSHPPVTSKEVVFPVEKGLSHGKAIEEVTVDQTACTAKLCPGRIRVKVGGKAIWIDSAFTFPNPTSASARNAFGSYSLIATTTSATCVAGQVCDRVLSKESGWSPTVTTTDNDNERVIRITAEGAYYRVTRTATIKKINGTLDGKINFLDTYENKSATQEVPIWFSSKINVDELTTRDYQVAGEPWTKGPLGKLHQLGLAHPGNPTVFVGADEAGVGAVIEDDVFRAQGAVGIQGPAAPPMTPDTVKFMEVFDRNFALKRGTTYQTEWNLYVTDSTSYYDFLNEVRNDTDEERYGKVKVNNGVSFFWYDRSNSGPAYPAHLDWRNMFTVDRATGAVTDVTKLKEFLQNTNIKDIVQYVYDSDGPVIDLGPRIWDDLGPADDAVQKQFIDALAMTGLDVNLNLYTNRPTSTEADARTKYPDSNHRIEWICADATQAKDCRQDAYPYICGLLGQAPPLRSTIPGGPDTQRGYCVDPLEPTNKNPRLLYPGTSNLYIFAPMKAQNAQGQWQYNQFGDVADLFFDRIVRHFTPDLALFPNSKVKIGTYIDEFRFSTQEAYNYHPFCSDSPAAPDCLSDLWWDGYSVELDFTNNTLKRKINNGQLAMKEQQIEFVQKFKNEGRPVIINKSPLIKSVEALQVPGFNEQQGGRAHYASALARGYLGTPVGYINTREFAGDAGRALTVDQAIDINIDALRDLLDYGSLGFAWRFIQNEPNTIYQTMYPITPLDLGRGYVVGAEKILTKKLPTPISTNSYGYNDSSKLVPYIYDASGRLLSSSEIAARYTAKTDASGHTYIQLNTATLQDEELVVIQRDINGDGTCDDGSPCAQTAPPVINVAQNTYTVTAGQELIIPFTVTGNGPFTVTATGVTGGAVTVVESSSTASGTDRDAPGIVP